MCLHGRFSVKGDLSDLELVFRRSLQKFGKPVRMANDKVAVYRSCRSRHIVGCLGIHGIVLKEGQLGTHKPSYNPSISASKRRRRSMGSDEMFDSPSQRARFRGAMPTDADGELRFRAESSTMMPCAVAPPRLPSPIRRFRRVYLLLRRWSLSCGSSTTKSG